MSSRGSSRVPLLAAVLCVIVTAVFAAVAFWQHGVAESKVEDAQQHEVAASLFQQAEGEGQTAGQLLQQYIATGDATLIPQINEHTSSGVTLLTSAIQESGIEGQPFLDAGTKLVQAEGQIIALRQAGDVSGAIAGAQALQTQFDAFLEQQNLVVVDQQNMAHELRNDAESADGVTSWMVIGAAIFAIGAVASGIVYVRGSGARRPIGALPSA